MDNARQLFESFRASLERDPSTDLREYLAKYRGTAEGRAELLGDLLDHRCRVQVHAGIAVDEEGLLREFPELSDEDFHQIVVNLGSYRRDRAMELLKLRGGAGTPPEDRPIIPGARRDGWREIGKGRQGVVYYACNMDLAREEAIKFLRGDMDRAERERLRHEAQTAAQIRHTNVCQVFEVGESYIVMAYAGRQTLDQWSGVPGRDPYDIARMMALVADGIDAAHRRGIVHYDVKPANILVHEEDNQPIVVDFGLSVRAALDAEGSFGGGTPAFMAPEQIRKCLHPDREIEVDRSADVYAMGATLYCLLLGRYPYQEDHDGRGLWERKLEGDPAPLLGELRRGRIPLDLQAIVLTAMALDPRERYASAGAMRDDLRAFVLRKPIVARLPTLAGRLRNKARRHPVALGIAAVVLLLAGLEGALGFPLSRQFRRAQIAQRLQQRLSTEPFDAAATGAIEADLERLDAIGPSQASDWRLQYVDRLIQLTRELTWTRLGAADTERLERCVRLVAERSPDHLARLRESTMVNSLRNLVAGYASSEDLYSFTRGDSDRIENLRNFVRIEERLAPGGGVVEAKRGLLRAYMARGDARSRDLVRAVDVAQGLLKEDLSPAWRMIVLRDYVWVAIQLKEGDPGILDDARARLDGSLRAGAATSSVFLPLLVERARVFAALGRFEDARTDMKRYFREVDKDRIRFREQRSADLLLGESPPENVPALFYFEACLLYGFLLENVPDRKNAEGYWRTGYRAAHITRSGSAYEAAVLGSLCGEISPEDADNMVVYTVENADPSGKDVAAQAVRYLTPSFNRVVADILNRAWASSRGRREAEDLVFRRTSFRRFTTVQIRLWLLEGFKMALAGRDGRGAILSGKEEDFLWELTEEVHRAFAADEVSGPDIVRTTVLAFGPDAPPPLLEAAARLSQIPRDSIEPGFAGWRKASRGLPVQLHSPIAFLLGRHYRLNCRDVEDSRAFFRMAYETAAGCRWADLLRSKARAEMQGMTTIPSR